MGRLAADGLTPPALPLASGSGIGSARMVMMNQLSPVPMAGLFFVRSVGSRHVETKTTSTPFKRWACRLF